MAKLEHFSYSTLSSYEYCSMKVFWSKVIGLKEPKNKHLDFGRRYHEEVDNYHKNKPYSYDLIKDYVEIIPQDFYSETEIRKELMIDDIKVVLVIDGINDQGLWDLKTMGASMSQAVADDSFQATIYCYWQWLQTGQIPVFNYLVFRKDVKAKMELEEDPKKYAKLKARLFQVVHTTRTLEQLKSLDSVFAILKANIEKDEFVRTNDTYKCKDCGFRRVCL